MKTVSAARGVGILGFSMCAAVLAVLASPAAAMTNEEALADLTANRGATAIYESRVVRSDREPAVYGSANFGGDEPVEFRCLISGGSVTSVRYLVPDDSGVLNADGSPEGVWVEDRPDGDIASIQQEAGSDEADPLDEEAAGADPADPVDEDAAGSDAVDPNDDLVKPVFQKPGDGSGFKRLAGRAAEADPAEGDEAEDKPLFQRVPQSN